jgi:hypothetical protein
MNTDFKDGIVRTKDEVIYLCDENGMYVESLFNWKTKETSHRYNVYMPKEFYLPVIIDRKTRYLIHNNDLILTLV